MENKPKQLRKFTLFRTAKSQIGELCTYDSFLRVTEDSDLAALCAKIASEEDPDKRGELKKLLPAITWQAYFPGRRISKEAEPSGLFMLDIDHVDDPWALYSEKIAGRAKELGIVFVGKTASCHGLRIVAKCLPTLSTIEDCQRWLASSLKVEYDGVCKDWARCSFLVYTSYTYYMNAQAIWFEEPEVGSLYAVGKNPVQINAAMEKALPATPSSPVERVDQREGLFGGANDYKGIPYADIIREWFYHTGGEPTEGERNVRLYQLAVRLRYITDFNEAAMVRIMPSYGLPESEVRELVRHALSAARGQNIPTDLQETLDKIDKQIKLGKDATEDDEIPDISNTSEEMPPLPPIFKQWCEVAPDDFKKPSVLCQLPILGALGSRLRGEYLDGRMHSPSFQVSLEAPQASGKSFMIMLAEYDLHQMIQDDESARVLERDYQEQMNKIRSTNTKVKKDELPKRPEVIIRYVPATMSITKMLMRMEAAQGLHLFALSPEIDTVKKAFARGFSSLSDALRLAFDNDAYGQDYASDQSYSGIVRLYYNTLYSGTPKSMCRFYPDVEDGLVSRVLFVSLPDQFGKPMPVWGKFTEEQKRIVDVSLTRLSEISLQGQTVMPEHTMKLSWLNKAMQNWIVAMQQQAVREDDRTRDIFCRRAAVVGFRAGMLAWFLYEEKNTPTIRRNVVKFAVWVSNCMLNQHILRFNVDNTHSNTIPFEKALKELPDEFTRKDAEQALAKADSNSPVKVVLYKWKLSGVIEEVERGRGKKGQKAGVIFKKKRK